MDIQENLRVKLIEADLKHARKVLQDKRIVLQRAQKDFDKALDEVKRLEVK